MAHRISLVNRDWTSFPAANGQNLLAAAEAAGVALPHGCRVGSCLQCAARLRGGKVDVDCANDLPDARLREYYLLLCCATARGDCQIEVGEPGAPLLPEARPWTE